MRIGSYLEGEFARAHGMRTHEPRQGRNAATAVCSASAVATLAFSFIADCGLQIADLKKSSTAALFLFSIRDPQSAIQNECLIKS